MRDGAAVVFESVAGPHNNRNWWRSSDVDKSFKEMSRNEMHSHSLVAHSFLSQLQCSKLRIRIGQKSADVSRNKIYHDESVDSVVSLKEKNQAMALIRIFFSFSIYDKQFWFDRDFAPGHHLKYVRFSKLMSLLHWFICYVPTCCPQHSIYRYMLY